MSWGAFRGSFPLQLDKPQHLLIGTDTSSSPSFAFAMVGPTGNLGSVFFPAGTAHIQELHSQSLNKGVNFQITPRHTFYNWRMWLSFLTVKIKFIHSKNIRKPRKLEWKGWGGRRRTLIKENRCYSCGILPLSFHFLSIFIHILYNVTIPLYIFGGDMAFETLSAKHKKKNIPLLSDDWC